jgi:hypothetical protein
LVQRLQDDSQLSKAAALLALTSWVLAADLQRSSCLPDINHNLLQLLASLAQQPLQSKLHESPELLQLMYEVPGGDAGWESSTIGIESELRGVDVQHVKQRPQASQTFQQSPAVSRFKQRLQGRARHGMPAAHAGDLPSEAGSSAGAESDQEFDPFDEESDLTDWGSNESYGPQEEVETRQGDEHQLSGDSNPSSTAAAAFPSAATRSTAMYRAAASLQAPCELQAGRAYPNSQQLLVKLRQACLVRLPFKDPAPDRCFTEQYLAVQLLRVLQGLPSPAFVLAEGPPVPVGQAETSEPPATLPSGQGQHWKLLHERFQPDPRLTTPSFSPRAVQQMLAEFADAGSWVRQLRQLAQQLTGHNKPASGTSQKLSNSLWQCSDASSGNIFVTSCLRGFGAALTQQLDLMGCQLAQLQGQLALQTRLTLCSNTPKTLSLLQVKQLARPVIRRVRVLNSVVQAIIPELRHSPPPAAAAALLDGLYHKAHAAETAASGAQGVADAAAVLHLLLSACLPLVAAVSQWLWTSADGGGAAAGADGSSAAAAPGLGMTGTVHEWGVQGTSCCSDDFFITSKGGVPASDPRFWHAAYEFSRSNCRAAASSAVDTASAAAAAATTARGHEARICCPAFLLPLVTSIMTAGKSVRLLEFMEQEELRHSSAGGTGKCAAAATERGQQHTWLRPNSSSSSSSAPSSRHLYNRAGKPGSASTIGCEGGSSASAGGEAAAACGGPGASRHSRRKQWSVAGGATAAAAAAAAASITSSPDWAAAAGRLSRQVRLQLAVAATAAGRQDSRQLPQSFIATACELLHWQQREQHMRYQVADQQHWPALNGGVSKAVLRRLVGVEQQLAHPCGIHVDLLTGPKGPQQKSNGGQSLREALQEVRAAQQLQLTCPGTIQAAVDGPHGLPHQQQQQQLSGTSGPQQDQQPCSQQHCHQQQELRADMDQLLDQREAHNAETAATEEPLCRPPSSSSGSSSSGAVDQPAAAAEDAVQTTNGGSCMTHEVPRLLQWRHQQQGALEAAGLCLQQMAPGQYTAIQGTQPPRSAGQDDDLYPAAGAAAVTTGSGISSSGSQGRAGSSSVPRVLREATSREAPGCFMGSLAGLWPLKPLSSRGFAGLRCAAAAAGRASAGAAAAAGEDSNCEAQPAAADWLTGSQCPSQQLVWLLLQPPSQLVPIPLLMEQALLQPIQERVRWRAVGHDCQADQPLKIIIELSAVQLYCQVTGIAWRAVLHWAAGRVISGLGLQPDLASVGLVRLEV